MNTPLTATTYEEWACFCQSLRRRDFPTAVDFTNTHIVTLRRADPSFLALTRCIDYFVPDGMPLIWCLNRQGAGLKDRVYGPTFMRHCLSTAPSSVTHYFLGGSRECVGRLREVFEKINPSARIVGARDGYFGLEDEAEILEELDRLSPDLIWIGLGTPKQQEWIARNKSRIRRGVLLAVGFAFDVNAGTKKDAPPWMQRTGLTWVFRAWTEPSRLGPRYARFNSLFLYFLLRDWLRRRLAT